MIKQCIITLMLTKMAFTQCAPTFVITHRKFIVNNESSKTITVEQFTDYQDRLMASLYDEPIEPHSLVIATLNLQIEGTLVLCVTPHNNEPIQSTIKDAFFSRMQVTDDPDNADSVIVQFK